MLSKNDFIYRVLLDLEGFQDDIREYYKTNYVNIDDIPYYNINCSYTEVKIELLKLYNKQEINKMFTDLLHICNDFNICFVFSDDKKFSELIKIKEFD